MDAGQARQADAAGPDERSWKVPFLNGAFATFCATACFWGAFREFRPPPEPVSFETLTKEADEVLRWAREFRELSGERSRVTDALERRIAELEAPQVAGADRSARDDEVRRLRQTLLAELETTNRLLSAKNAEFEERKRSADAPRQERVARAAWEWQRHQSRLLATALAATALAGWLFRQAHLRHRPQVVAERPAGTDSRRSARRRAEAGDPQWNQKLLLYAFYVAIGVSMVLYGLFGREPRPDEEDHREMAVFVGLFCLAMSTLWLFFGSIDWSTWNTIKDRVSSRTSRADDEHPPDPAADAGSAGPTAAGDVRAARRE